MHGKLIPPFVVSSPWCALFATELVSRSRQYELGNGTMGRSQRIRERSPFRIGICPSRTSSQSKPFPRLFSQSNHFVPFFDCPTYSARLSQAPEAPSFLGSLFDSLSLARTNTRNFWITPIRATISWSASRISSRSVLKSNRITRKSFGERESEKKSRKSKRTECEI